MELVPLARGPARVSADRLASAWFVPPVALLVIMFGSALSGCGGEDAQEPLRPRVTFEDYELGYRAFIDCLRQRNVWFEELGLDAETRLFEYGVEAPEDLQDAGPADPCYEEHFHAVDEAWQLQQLRDFREQEVHRPAILACLEQRGFPLPEPGMSMRELIEYVGSITEPQLVEDAIEGNC
jgi:hypothetical protein